LEAILTDHEQGRKEEDVAPHLTTAYKTTLERYHNFIIKKTFNVSLDISRGSKIFLSPISDFLKFMFDVVKEILQMEN